MAHISEFGKSNYLKKEDCGNGLTVTIKECIRENVGKDDGEQEEKYVLHFLEDGIKPMVCNITNAQLIGIQTGQEDSDNWPGHKITLYNDRTIMYAGKLIGGIRVRVGDAPPMPRTAPPVQGSNGDMALMEAKNAAWKGWCALTTNDTGEVRKASYLALIKARFNKAPEQVTAVEWNQLRATGYKVPEVPVLPDGDFKEDDIPF